MERQWQGEMPFHFITSKVAGSGHTVLSCPKSLASTSSGVNTFGWSKLKAPFIIYDECHGATNQKSLMWKMLKTATRFPRSR